SAASTKLHGSAGTFDVDLPLSGAPGIDCRSGATGDHTMVFTFSNPLTNVANAAVTNGAGQVEDAAIGSDPHEYLVHLTGVSNAQITRVTLTNMTDANGSSINSASGALAVLSGDTNADGLVNSTDIEQTKSQSGISVNLSNFREDVTADGSLNSADIASTKSKSGSGLP
ncbi:MAG: hypothetical protein QOG48_1257, partial [Verrucomicrobiota bacterium]